jgi:hypothetical protein
MCLTFFHSAQRSGTLGSANPSRLILYKGNLPFSGCRIQPTFMVLKFTFSLLRASRTFFTENVRLPKPNIIKLAICSVSKLIPGNLQSHTPQAYKLLRIF